MADYKGTDVELIAVADAIRAKGGTSAPLEWPDGFISAIEAIPTGGGVTIVPWATGTDAEIAAMVAALDAGTLTIQETGWQIGDERTVSLAAMEATGVGESHAAQTATLVLMDSQHYDLTVATAGGDTKDHFVVGLKDCLNEPGYIESPYTSNGWDRVVRRTWCNSVFYNALPEDIRGCFKQFKCKASGGDFGNLQTTNDYIALFATKEVVGSRGYSYSSEDVLTQIAYYVTASNRQKKTNGSYLAWWFRSNSTENNRFCAANNTTSGSYYKNSNYGIAPFGCI